MVIKLVCRTSKKGNEYVALLCESEGKETILTYDMLTISRVTGYTMKDLYTMSSGEEIYF